MKKLKITDLGLEIKNEVEKNSKKKGRKKELTESQKLLLNSEMFGKGFKDVNEEFNEDEIKELEILLQEDYIMITQD